MKTTIYEIAKKSNVSIATVSRAMNSETRYKVAPETAQTIDFAIHKLQYTPNIAAKHLGKSKFMTIGILFPHHKGIFVEDYYSKILCGVSDALLESDYRLKTVMLKCEKPRWDKYDFKAGEGIDGLIVTHWHAFFSDQSVLDHLRIPIVVISDVEENVRAHFVSGDHFQGGILAARYLHSQGHKNIGILTGPPDSKDSELRLKGVQTFFTKAGISIDPENIVCGHFQEEKAYQLTESLIKKNKNLTAIFCLNDGMAFGVLRRLKELDIRCPEQISVMGYDDDRRGETINPALTTIQVPIYELAKEAAEKLVAHLNKALGKKDFYTKTFLPVKLIERQSVKKVI